FSAFRRSDQIRTMNLVRFLQGYTRWQRLAATTVMSQSWYRLRLSYPTGILGTARSAMDVEFFDGSGEGFQQSLNSEIRSLWRNLLEARVMIFCLPLWTAFPGAGLTPNDWIQREAFLESFEQVFQNYLDIKTRYRGTQATRIILVLTMADDQRSALKTLYDRWIAPYLDSPQTYLRQLRSNSGVARYLANARRISSALH